MCVNGAYLDLEDGGKGVDGMTTVFPFFFLVALLVVLAFAFSFAILLLF